MAQLTSKERIEKGKNIIENKLQIKFKEAIHPFLLKLSKGKIGYKIEKNCEYSGKVKDFSDNRPIIFVCNHGTSYDVPIAFTAINEHAYLFAGKQKLETIDELFFNLNGTIYVDRKDKEDMKLSKKAIIELLNKKKNILVFPEGTWNLTDSLIINELKWGIIDVAKKTNAIIVPMALDYDFDKKICRYTIGDSIDVSDKTLQDGIRIVRDSMASLKWDLFEKKGMFKRSDIESNVEKKKIMRAVDEYPALDYEYEKSVVYHSNPTPDEVFGTIKKLKK